ncbi:Small nuclear ribonucleoprotein family protein [Prunus dulcis]|uniref:Small nuclear ribonucleoprotein family protein n=1 Tax=Prunus dulcis TaxID=3755 RepID=A0A4Y1RUZ8_PRUDU|nr:Small nuclear ribonucleoprotein family protein [Prunus dulcis]
MGIVVVRWEANAIGEGSVVLLIGFSSSRFSVEEKSTSCRGLAQKTLSFPLLLQAILTKSFLSYCEMAESSWDYYGLLISLKPLLILVIFFPVPANVVLEGACERVIVGDLYCDIPLGLYVIRGENVVLIGELELGKEELPPHMTLVPEAEIKRAQKAERDATDLKGSMRKRMEFLDFD